MVIPTITLEKDFWSKGYPLVAGVDEAGKGPLAGPVTAGAVLIRNPKQVVSSVRDSKLMSKLQRERAYEEICRRSSAYGVGIVSEKVIDRIGIDLAVRFAMLQALKSLENMLHDSLSYVIVDGSKTKPLKEYPSIRIKKGGLYHYSIAAGSILAKVTRDKIMQQNASLYPEYGFAEHVGYGTKKHLEQLQRYGPCPIHRMSFAPIKDL